MYMNRESNNGTMFSTRGDQYEKKCPLRGGGCQRQGDPGLTSQTKRSLLESLNKRLNPLLNYKNNVDYIGDEHF